MTSAASAVDFTGVKTFTSSLHRDRGALGEVITAWLASDTIVPLDLIVRQSSDATHHCLTIVVFYRHA